MVANLLDTIQVEPKDHEANAEELQQIVARCLLIAARRGRALRQKHMSVRTVPGKQADQTPMQVVTAEDNYRHGGLDHNKRSEQPDSLQHGVHPLADSA